MGTENGITPASAAPDTQGESKPSGKKYYRRGLRKSKNAGTVAKAIIVRQPRFEGKCPEMQGHIYGCTGSQQSDIFTKNTKEIAEYVGHTFRCGGDIMLDVDHLEHPTMLVKPIVPVADSKGKVDPIDKLVSEKEVADLVKQRQYLTQNMCTLYSLVWGQCTCTMRQRVEVLKTYDMIHNKSLDGLELLKAIKGQAFNFNSQKNRKHALQESTRPFFQLTRVDVIEHSGGVIGYAPGVKEDLATREGIDVMDLNDDKLAEFNTRAQEEYLAVIFILHHADKARFGQDQVTRILQITGSDGISFTNIDGGTENEDTEDVPNVTLVHDGKPRKDFKKANITCFRCGEKGH
eukprot:scaffold7210_cov63-Attheya_sp.AAC.7